MHARSGAWRCCVGEGRGARVQCEILLAATFIICWTLNLHWFVLLGSSKKFTFAITEILLYRKSTGVILRDAFPALQRLCTNGPFEDCKVQMCVKQRLTHSWSSYFPGKKYIYPDGKIVKSRHHYVLSQWKRFWVHIYALCICLRLQMFYPNRRIEIWQVRMFVKQRRTHSWSSYLPEKKYIYPQGKIVKSLHHYVLSQWKRFWVYIYALCIGLRSQMLYPNRRIEIWQVRLFVKQRRKHGWSSYLPGKSIFIPQQKSSNLYIIYVVCQWKRFWLCIYAHCSNMRSQMLYTRGSFEISKNECLSNSVENTGEAVTCQGKVYLSHSKNRKIST